LLGSEGVLTSILELVFKFHKSLQFLELGVTKFQVVKGQTNSPMVFLLEHEVIVLQNFVSTLHYLLTMLIQIDITLQKVILLVLDDLRFKRVEHDHLLSLNPANHCSVDIR